ncbi:hypothetical protein QCA50_020064 [Cerrena zonata]|uniref:Large ribosomal subunit protein mL46 n=1 Tax=Cerrena zonata TaxID=2478898 RepID=A0AAW0F9Q9_9APHY
MFSRASPKVQRLHASVRCLATEASTSASQSPSTPPLPQRRPSPGSSTSNINAAIILNRAPIITRSPTPFERTYHAYQARIRRALHNPFPYDFYFKPGSLLEGKFRDAEREREREAFGRMSSSSGEDDVEDTSADTPSKDSELLDGQQEIKSMPRIHESDKTGNVQELNRQGERNLYLLVHGKDSTGKQVWRFPQGGLKEDEALHQAALRELHAECGKKMDTWIVSKNPVGVYQPSPQDQTHYFFYKAHILSGQVQPDGKNVTDFAWLTKQEIESRVEKPYWLGVKDMLADF